MKRNTRSVSHTIKHLLSKLLRLSHNPKRNQKYQPCVRRVSGESLPFANQPIKMF